MIMNVLYVSTSRKSMHLHKKIRQLNLEIKWRHLKNLELGLRVSVPFFRAYLSFLFLMTLLLFNNFTITNEFLLINTAIFMLRNIL